MKQNECFYNCLEFNQQLKYLNHTKEGKEIFGENPTVDDIINKITLILKNHDKEIEEAYFIIHDKDRHWKDSEKTCTPHVHVMMSFYEKHNVDVCKWFGQKPEQICFPRTNFYNMVRYLTHINDKTGKHKYELKQVVTVKGDLTKYFGKDVL